MDSILTSIKKLLGITEDQDSFDQDIIMHINSTLSVLTQIGVGPTTGFSITDDSETWSDFLSTSTNLELVKSYIYLKVRLLFDPPSSSAVMEAINRSIAEFEWRLSITAGAAENQNGGGV